ncbi:DUF3787 domain-containing protein [Aceticella autotrophica]|uniref:DUF3787 domain-containing protein n=1 Tax=Aceticella autotrophica TaxID=2755338 RepID=A0A975AWA3_9THEO|nr:DUF3787 domain-containing protein [Aceticella autotrophica]QSZ27632.1 DUF3787 domain-containing protein [Aceticella autotrophica]
MIRKSKKSNTGSKEKHDTSLENIKKTSKEANIKLPSESSVIEAKKWVEKNQK